jgi:capsid protein
MPNFPRSATKTKPKPTPRPRPKPPTPPAEPKPPPAPPSRIAAKWEAAIGSRSTVGHFVHADTLGPLASTDSSTRESIRSKTRYERQNNPALAGLVRTLSTSIVGTGPRARVGGIADNRARRLEKLWTAWAKAAGLTAAFRLGVEGYYQDGDALAQLVLDPTPRPGVVPLALVNYEAEQCGDPNPFQPGPGELYGVRVDALGRPTHYHVYNVHPGDGPTGGGLTDPFAGKWIESRFILHFHKPERPGQLRGVSPFAPALNGGAQARRYSGAVLGSAEKAARVTGVVETELGPEGTPSPPVPYEVVPVLTESVVTLPAGSKFTGHEPGQPTAQYGEYIGLKNAEWGAPVGAPKAVVNLNSENASFSSARLDQLIFRDGCWLEKENLAALLDKVWALWFELLTLQPEHAGYAADEGLTVEFLFPGFSAMDPLKDSKAVGEALDRGLTNLAIECAERGLDWREVQDQKLAEELRLQQRRKALGLGPVTVPGGPGPDDEPEPDDEPPEPDEVPADETALEGSAPAYVRATAPPSTFAAVGSALALEAAGEGQAARRFSAVAYSGAAMSLPASFGAVPAVVDLAGLTIPAGPVPILRQHDHDRILGHATARIEGGRVLAAGVLSMPGAEVDQVITAALAGFPWQASIAGPFTRVEFIEGGKSVTVNGRQLRGPLNVVRAAVLREITVTPLGADGATSVQIAATLEGLPMEFSTWLTARGLTESNLNPAARTTLEAAWRAETATPPPSPPPPPAPAPDPTPPPGSFEATIAAQRAEDARRGRITELVSSAISSDRSRLDVFEAIGRDSINNNWSTLQTENAILQARLVGHANPTLPPSRGGQVDAQVIECAVARTLRVGNIEKQYTPQVLEAAHRQYPRGIGLVEPYLIAARQNGYHGSPSDLMAMMTAAHQHQLARPGYMAANASTIDVPNLLSNVAEKILVERFAGTEQAWREIGKIRSTKDYKPISSMRMIGIDRLRRVPKNGEIEHGTIGDMAYANKVSPYALMVGISEEDLTNDDLGAFGEIPAALADSSGEAINEEFWSVWAALQATLFPTNDANHNYVATASILDLTGLNNAEKKFRAQTKPKAQPTETSRPLGILPEILLVASGQENTALTLMGAQTLIGVNTGTPQPNVNVFAGKYKVVSSAYLDAAYALEWWLLANPNRVAAIEVALLGGRETPRIETMPYSFERLGTQWRCTWGFGIAAQEYRAGVRMKGTATLLAADEAAREGGPDHDPHAPAGDATNPAHKPTQLPADPHAGRRGR